MDRVRLALEEQPADEAQWLVLRRSNTQLLAELLEVVGSDHPLARIDRDPGRILIVEPVGQSALVFVIAVIGFGVVGIVVFGIGLAIEIGTGIGHIPVADLALDGQRCLDELVVAEIRVEVLIHQLAHGRIEAVGTVALGILVHHRGSDGPAVVQIDLERGARTVAFGVIDVALHMGGIVDRHAILDAAHDIAQKIVNRGAAESPVATDIVNIAGIALPIADHAQCRAAGKRQIDHAFELAAVAAVLDMVDLAIGARFDPGGRGLVGDDADRAGFRRSAVKCALRTRKAFDTGDVIDVDIKIAADRRNRLLIKIDADRGQRAGMVAIAARGNAAHVDHAGARSARRLRRDPGQLLRIGREVRDVELIELLGAQCLDRDRHVLKVFTALLRGHDDDVRILVISVPSFLGQGRKRDQRRTGEQRGKGGAVRGGTHENPTFLTGRCCNLIPRAQSVKPMPAEG